MFRSISLFILKLWGWKVTGPIPYHLPKYIIAVVPHTSNWDFPLGILIRSAYQIPTQYIAKSTLFKPPFGWLFRWSGGVPVDRSKNNNFVDAVAAIYKERSHFVTTIAPEGTRKKVTKLKTGFYYIALKSNIPIILLAFDWQKKELCWREPFYPTGDLTKDFDIIHDFFRGAKGKNPKDGFL